MEKRITVFTPTYNRAYIIKNLYDSLVKQTFKDFEWVVVDDGSTDNTERLIQKFIDEKIINVSYHKQENGGKHRAINRGLDFAKGELFFIVDSDDYLTENALEILVKNWSLVEDKSTYCGITGLKGYSIDNVVGNTTEESPIDSNILDYRYKYRIKGDKAEAFVTELLKENKFPGFEGENFISESIIWNYLGSKYKMRWFNEIIYICDYLDDGLSSNITKLRINNIRGTLLVYKTNLDYNIPYIYKIRNAINYYRFLFQSNLSRKDYILKNVGLLNPIGVIGGLILNINDRRITKK